MQHDEFQNINREELIKMIGEVRQYAYEVSGALRELQIEVRRVIAERNALLLPQPASLSAELR